MPGKLISVNHSRVGRKKRWAEDMQARFPEGTFERITAVLNEGEDRTDFVRSAVEAELKRREKDIYFFKGRSECDFIVKQGFDVKEAIQVTVTMSDDKTRKREIRGLMDCCEEFGLQNGLIITLDSSEEFDLNGVEVNVMPLYRWLLA